MGTTLTGTTPQDTYDSLIKVTDNGPISGTAKFLSDGLGNDSALALSTTSVGIGRVPTAGFVLDIETGLGPFPRITGSDQANVRLRFANGGSGGRNYELIGGLAGANNSNFSIFDATAAATRLTIDSTGNVGIGTSAPNAKLHILQSVSGASPANLLRLSNNGVGFTTIISLSDQTTVDGFITCKGDATTANQFLAFGLNASTDTLKITGNNFVRLNSTSGGIQFNGDTAAANALDDYEEGTWTMGVQFGGASVGVTFSQNTGAYTKIGRQVTATGQMVLTSKGAEVGDAVLTGLPFTAGNNSQFHSGVSFGVISSVTFADMLTARVAVNSTTFEFYETTNAGALSALTNADFANSSQIAFSVTYFV